MCRKNLHFKGFYKLKYEWEEKRHEDMCQRIFAEGFDEICEMSLESTMFLLLILEDRLNKMKFLSQHFSEDDTSYVVMDFTRKILIIAMMYEYYNIIKPITPKYRPVHNLEFLNCIT